MRIGVDVMPAIPRDTTDRNRTSPLAFTGNKFEFRMPGSSQSIAEPNIALNTIMAEELSKFADILENAEDFDVALQKLVCDAFTAHQRILFNGNGYSDEWKEEARLRGLSNLSATAEALQSYTSDKSIALVTKRGIYTEAEYRARYEIHLDAYCKLINIEARTSVDMVMQQILPAAMHYSSDLAKAISRKAAIGIGAAAERDLLNRLSKHTDALYNQCEKLRADLAQIPRGNNQAAADYFHAVIVADMDALRLEADILEQLTDKSYWPYPTYSDILFY